MSGMHKCGWATYAIIVATVVSFSFANATEESEGGIVTGTFLLTKGKLAENSIVYLEGVKGNHEAPDASGPSAVLDQKVDTFVPHILPIQLGQSVSIRNSDPHVHNVHPYIKGKSLFNVAQMAGKTREWTPKNQGNHLILCDIHNEMSAFVVVLDHPYFAVLNHDPAAKEPSTFTFKNVPPGSYELVLLRDIKGRLKSKRKKLTVSRNKTTTVKL